MDSPMESTPQLETSLLSSLVRSLAVTREVAKATSAAGSSDAQWWLQQAAALEHALTYFLMLQEGGNHEAGDL